MLHWLWHHNRRGWTGRYNLYDPCPVTHALACVVYCRFSSHQYGRGARCPGCCNDRHAGHRSQNPPSCCGRRCHLRICHGSAHSKRHNIRHWNIIHNTGRRHIAAQNLTCRENIQHRRRHSKTAHELRTRRYND